jgi:shikimate kinase
MIIKRDLIYVTGFMAGGKSTIGSILANTIDYSFMDIDKHIEKITGEKITDIFAGRGETYFREYEREILSEFSKAHRYVISLGGGTITHIENFSIIKSTGVLIYLKAGVEHIYKRLRFKSDRPILKSKEGIWLRDDQLKTRIIELLEVREPFYLKSDLIVETDNKPIGNTIDEIIRKLKPLINL